MADKLTIETCKTVKDYLDNFVPDGAFVQINDAMNVDVDGHLVYSGEKENVPQKLMERLKIGDGSPSYLFHRSHPNGDGAVKFI